MNRIRSPNHERVPVEVDKGMDLNMENRFNGSSGDIVDVPVETDVTEETNCVADGTMTNMISTSKETMKPIEMTL
jgi:hypothetical protein